MELSRESHLAPGRPAQEMTVSLSFPEGSPRHFPTSQPAAQLLPLFVDTTSGRVLSPYITPPHLTSDITPSIALPTHPRLA